MNTPGSVPPRSPGATQSLWHPSTWSHYINQLVQATRKSGPPVHLTRRQELLAAQEQKRREQHAHVLELLREVKEKHQHESDKLKI